MTGSEVRVIRASTAHSCLIGFDSAGHTNVDTASNGVIGRGHTSLPSLMLGSNILSFRWIGTLPRQLCTKGVKLTAGVNLSGQFEIRWEE